MNILSLPLGADTGGVSESIRRAFVNVPGWEFRAIISTLNYIDYPRDMAWSRHNVKAFWQWADIIHLHHNLSHLRRLNRWRLPPRPFVLEFHGTGYREQPEWHLAEMRLHGATGVVSTLDLYLLAPTEVEWLPCPVNVEAMQSMRRPTDDDVIRIAHAPTDREIKSTAPLLEAVGQLQSEGHPVELVLIEGRPWAECLRRKASADIYFDQVKLGYGNNSIEAWGMGIPVIAGGAPDTLAEMERRFGSLPFYNATEATIYTALKALVTDPALRAEYSQRGLEHVRAWHDEAKVVAQLQGIYRRAAEQGKERAA